MDPFEGHLFTLLRKLLSFLGFWYTQPYRERILRYFIIGPLLFYALLAQLCQISAMNLNLQSIVFVLQLFIPSLSFASIYFSFIIHFPIMREIFYFMKQDWQRLDDNNGIKVMQKYAYESKLFTLICGFMFFFFTNWIIWPPIISKILSWNEKKGSADRFPLYTCVDYFLDRGEYYYYISLVQIIFITLEVLVAIGCYSAFFLIIQHVCALLFITKNKINQMFQSYHQSDKVAVKPVDLSYWMVDIIQCFARIKEFVRFVNKLSEKCYLFQMSLAFFLIVVDFLCIFQIPNLLQHKESRKDAFAFFCFIIATVSPIYLNCYIGQRLMDYSVDVYKEACLIPIHEISLKTQKLLLTMLIMNAKPCAISIGKVFVSSHEFFSDTGHMRTSSGSYFINPTKHWRDNVKDSMMVSSLEHAIYRVPPATESQSYNNNNHVNDDRRSSGRNCAVIDYDTKEKPVLLTDDSSGNQIYVGDRLRERRSLTVKTSMDHSKEDDEEIEDSREINEYVNDEYEQFLGHRENRNSLRDDRYYSVDRRRNYPKELYGQNSEMESDPFVTWRPRRALPREYFIEIMVVADAKMVEYHGNNLDSYILVLMSTVSRIYKDRSIGNPVSISVTKIIQTDEVFGKRDNRRYGISAQDMLKQFCRWQKLNNPDEPSPEHHDAALLLTRENLCHDPSEQRCDTLGLAELGKMCSPEASCAIVQDNGLAAAFTIAHEIGHVLNMPHDDDTKCDDFRNHSSIHNVMSRMLDDKTFPWEWSRCSRHHVTEFLEADYANCLLNEPSKTIRRPNARRLPGEDYSKNKQCELVFGPGSEICHDMVSNGKPNVWSITGQPVCRKLWCTVPMWGNHCHTEHMPWADGTSCGNGKWCQRGECVSKQDLKPVDGQWGQWGPYGDCSRTCGGGIMRKTRDCDNPPPLNGGNYCVGDRVKYKSCGTDECPAGSPDFREQQCAKYNNNNLNIQNLARDVKWHAKYTQIQPEDRCKLYCQVESNQYYMLRDKVIDGTPCGPDTFHLCVNGRCKPAGCDNVLNSTAELDTCGVCRGDNSTCQRISGSYNITAYGYNKVVKIPAGSSNIDIRQHKWSESLYDDNYLALRMGEDGEYILNGKFVIMHRKVLVYPGVTIEYSGPKSAVERLNSSRPISTDLIVEILSVGVLRPPQITYEYTVPKKILKSYTWSLSDWSDCDRMCQGTKHRKAECRSTEHKDVVPDDYCRTEERPREESQMCNGHCILQWQVTSVSECSSHCGPGTQRPSEQEACVGPCNDVHWKYGEWGACDVTCGGGIQYRIATCVDSNDRQLPDEACTGQEKHLKKMCGQEACPKWALGKWSACSVSCGIGERHRSYWCHVDNRIVPHSNCSDIPIRVTDVCDAGPCYSWQAGDWSPCSATCGEGIQRRKVICKGTDGSTSGKCLPSEKPDDWISCVLKPCLTGVNPIIYSPDPPHEDPYPQDNEIDSNGITFRAAYQWRTGQYGKCSESCNGGIMTRIVKCVSVDTSEIVSNDYCNADRRPPTTIVCNHHPCPNWITGGWSQCSVECGSGLQHRQVRCQNSRNEVLPDKECLAHEKPSGVKKCRKSCVKTKQDHNHHSEVSRDSVPKWKVSNWTPCSKSCGGGIKTRRVECTMSRRTDGQEVPVSDEQCTKFAAKPRYQRQCQRIPCDYTWQEGAWSECSAKCGDGMQQRTVSCHRVNRYGWIDPTPTDGCPMNQRPVTEQKCKLRECNDKFYWSTSSWKKCSQPCGRKGRQVRRLYCQNRVGRIVSQSKCPIELRPQKKRKCNQRKCGPLNCHEAKKRFSTTKDGEYPLIIGGKNMSIYCHAMSTLEPHEYLTLPAGDQENYAEIYDKRLKSPQTCPYGGERNDSCKCVTDHRTRPGVTMFKRVRLDPTKLYIIGDDYTFSQTKGLNRVEYGKAGDCYSLQNCPQGRFSINLSGTHLRLSSEVTWTTLSSRAFHTINRINDQQIFGKCGGYCGFCIPSSGLKLDVLPP